MIMASDEKKSLVLRIDKKLWDELNSWAKDELRSINGQIEFILRDSVISNRNKNFGVVKKK